MKRERVHPPTLRFKDVRRIATKALFNTAVAYLFLAALPYHQTFSILVEGLKEKMHPTAPEVLSADNLPFAPLEAVLGGGVFPDGDVYQISKFQRRREMAGAEAVQLYGMADEVLLLDGVKPDGAGVNITKCTFLAMEKELANGNRLQVPEDKITVETKSTSTATNIDGLKKYMEEHNINSVIVITDEFHRIRTETLLKIKGVNAVVVTVEQLAQLRSDPAELAEIRQQDEDPSMKKRKFSENVKYLALFLDPYGKAMGQLESLFVR